MLNSPAYFFNEQLEAARSEIPRDSCAIDRKATAVILLHDTDSGEVGR